jgi:signal transduction histidine kinase
MKKYLNRRAMPSKMNESLIQYLSKNSSIIFLIINKEGKILESNEFADNLTGKKLTGQLYTEIIINFGKTVEISEYLNHTEEKILVNVNTHSTLPETYFFKFYDLGNTVLALGESDRKDVNLLRKNLLELNQEMSNINRKLEKKTAEMKKLIDLKNQFLGMAAHDLRTPISTIMGFSDLLIEGYSEYSFADQMKMIHTIKSLSKFMLRLLNDLLDITKFESGKIMLEKQKVDIASLIRKNIELNNVIAQNKKIKIEFKATETLPEINIDPHKIIQVLNNLISNAIKFSSPGSLVLVEIKKDENQIIVSVKDQGPGIPESEISKLFHPFQTTSVKSTGGEKSTGLGLSIVRKIIVGHKGKVWVESTIGKGSTFYFTLLLFDNQPIIN